MPEHDEFTKEQLQKIGERIKALRKAKGYTNYEHFAYDNGINRVQYGRYEKGADLKISSLIKVLKGFDMSLTEFFAEGFE